MSEFLYVKRRLCGVLQSVAVWFNMLQFVAALAVRCSYMYDRMSGYQEKITQCVAACCSMLQLLQCIAAIYDRMSGYQEKVTSLIPSVCCICRRLMASQSYNMLQHAETRCNTLQHAAPHCIYNSRKKEAASEQHTATHCNALQHTTAHCNTLQHATTH